MNHRRTWRQGLVHPTEVTEAPDGRKALESAPASPAVAVHQAERKCRLQLLQGLANDVPAFISLCLALPLPALVLPQGWLLL